jgi:hypothetical protein
VADGLIKEEEKLLNSFGSGTGTGTGAGTGAGAEPEPEPEPKLFQCRNLHRNWNCNKPLRLHNTAMPCERTAIPV